MPHLTVVGGGLAGLVTAILISRKGYSVTLIEKKRYPLHRVCGEYISNEVKPFLKKHGLFPDQLGPANIKRFELTSTRGKHAELPLTMGGFGISRYSFDHFLYQKAVKSGVEFVEGVAAQKITFHGNRFLIELSNGTQLESDHVVGAHGKRSTLDKSLKRTFMKRRSPYIGVKYHIKTAYADDAIALHNFNGGYCGINKVENDRFNLCYLSRNDNLKNRGSIEAMEREVLCKNPFLREIFTNSEFLFKSPIVINEISFETKTAVEQHILMAGDAAGMIAPLCGNGMAMAIHTAKLVSDHLLLHFSGEIKTRSQLEHDYRKTWNNLFARRLWVGRRFQGLFGSSGVSSFSVGILQHLPSLGSYLVEKTHGKAIV